MTELVNINWSALAVFVTAMAAAIVSVGTWLRQGKMQQNATAAHIETNTKVDALVKSVDGQTHALNTALSEQAMAEGQLIGRDHVPPTT